MKRLLLAAALGFPQAAPAAELQLLGTYAWSDPDPRMGGLSGLDMRYGGELVALSDRGVLLIGTVTRSAEGVIEQIAPDTIAPLFNGHGSMDSEGLSFGPQPSIWVSFEGPARIAQVMKTGYLQQELPPLPGAEALQVNASLEALAIAENGDVYTLAERSGRANWPYSVLRFSGGAWETAFELERVGPFLPVGADIGPDGRLYLLERDSLGVWFRSRIRRMKLDGTEVETLFQSGFGDHDNLEGISVWQDRRWPGEVRITLVSDDNFLFLQKTEFVDFKLVD